MTDLCGIGAGGFDLTTLSPDRGRRPDVPGEVLPRFHPALEVLGVLIGYCLESLTFSTSPMSVKSLATIVPPGKYYPPILSLALMSPREARNSPTQTPYRIHPSHNAQSY